MENQLHIRELIVRLARLEGASAWEGDLNPTQRAVLVYLGRANRFSRSPSHVAEYLGSTRGTISQSFKSLLQKGYVREHRSELDKRAISFDLTPKGQSIAREGSGLEQSIAALNKPDRAALHGALQALLKGELAKNNGRAFGVCNSCLHFQASQKGGFCGLLSETLLPEEVTLICHEQVSAST